MGKSKVVVVGLGYVGLPLALLTQSNGYDVTGIDFDKTVVLNDKKVGSLVQIQKLNLNIY